MARPIKKTARAKGQATVVETEYDNTNTGVLFENAKKKSDKHPDFQGSFTDEAGREFWVSGWEKTSRSGQYYISLAFTEKQESEEEEEEEEAVLPAKRPRRKNG